MKTGDQLLIHNPFDIKQQVTYLSWAIRKVCGIFFNHSAIIVVIAGKIYVVEAVFPKVIITEYPIWQKKYDRVVKVQKIESKFSEEELTHRILAQIGKKYDWWSLLVILKYLVTGKWIGKTGKDAAKKLYCYELVAYVHGIPSSWMILPTE